MEFHLRSSLRNRKAVGEKPSKFLSIILVFLVQQEGLGLINFFLSQEEKMCFHFTPIRSSDYTHTADALADG